MQLIDHLPEFTTGVRVLQLTGRNKDNVSKRMIHRVSKDKNSFETILMEMVEMSKPGERIYASASGRNLNKAAKLLKLRMVENDYVPDPIDFYRSLNSRWVSCLMDPTCQDPKMWMFDCDTPEEYDSVSECLDDLEIDHYLYGTKNGHHILVKPFDKRKITKIGVTTLIHDNPLLLWGY